MANNYFDRQGKNSLNQQRLRTQGADVQLESAPPTPGSDPYNTSGSFDRSKNWERVRKR